MDFGGLALALLLFQAAPEAKPAEPPKPDAGRSADSNKRVELNLLGKTDTDAGESRRNENVQFNLVDNNALKELNIRLGTTATIVQEFQPEKNYFGAEFGNAPASAIHVSPVTRRNWHGKAYWSHLNSIFSARSFFQVGDVQPAHENDYGISLMAPWLQVDASQQKLRGQVNGNVLVPMPDERVALAAEPATRAIVQRFLDAFPRRLPNRTDINPRALNTNAPQLINNDNLSARLDPPARRWGRITALYSFTSQHVEAFQLVAGQNPNTDTRNHRARLTWVRAWGQNIVEATAGFDRIGSLLVPEPNAVGPMVSVAGLTTLGPLAAIPIDRALNLFRYGAQLRRRSSTHNLTLGFATLRRQLNGQETDAHRGVLSFGNDFGRDSITNFRLGFPTQYIVSLGDIHRGFRNWDIQLYAGDSWRLTPGVQLTYALRYQPVTTPFEVNRRNDIPYPCDCNNLAPQLGLAWRPRRASLGVLRFNYGLHYGEIFPVTFQQVRFSPPGSVKIVVTAPSLNNPLVSRTQEGAAPQALGNLYLLAPDLRTPYSHQYNFAWEPAWKSQWKLQLGYVGSRSHKLLLMWYLNRAHAVDGIPQTTATINQRRPDPLFAEKRLVINGSRGYFDAARATLIVPRWRGLSLDASYWFSKAIDLGSAYTNTAYDGDSRLSRSQSEYEQHRDMKALSAFDQPHALLLRASYSMAPRAGRWLRHWTLASVVLLKSGTPFGVQSGSDGPGYGNVDGNGGDRPNLLDTSILGRTIGHPDTSLARLPRSAFAYINPTDEFGGNLGRNTFRKGGIYNVNASLARSFQVSGDRRLTLRAESINFFNTPQFAEPGYELANPNFGFITNTLNDGRTFRFALQFAW
jgi:hypothetical protein